MKGMKGLALIGLVFVAIAVAMIIIQVPADAKEGLISSPIVSGVQIIDDANVKMTASPDIITHSQPVYFNLTTKSYTGNIDVYFGFDYPSVSPTKAELYNPRILNNTQSYVCNSPNWFNYTFNGNYRDNTLWCWNRITLPNSTIDNLIYTHSFETANIASKTVYWNEPYLKEYSDVSDHFDSINYDYEGMNKWYYVNTVPVIAGKEYSLKVDIRVPFNSDNSLKKYWYCAKPSGETLKQAKTNGHFFCLDPWWSSWYYPTSLSRRNFTVSNAETDQRQNVQIVFNVTYNNSMAVDFSDLRFTYFNVSTQAEEPMNFWIENFNRSSNARIWAKLPVINLTYPTTFIMYYNNSSVAGAANESNGNNTFLFFDDFNFFGTNSPSLDLTKWDIDTATGVLGYGGTNGNYLTVTGGGGAGGMTITSDYSIPTVMNVSLESNLTIVIMGAATSWHYGLYTAGPNMNTLFYQAPDEGMYNCDGACAFTSLVYHNGDGTWNMMKIVKEMEGAPIEYLMPYQNGVNLEAVWHSADIGATTNQQVVMDNWKTDSTYYDYIFLRKWMNPDPTITANRIETGGTVTYLTLYNITNNSYYYYPNQTFNTNFTVKKIGTSVIGQTFIKLLNGTTYDAGKTKNTTQDYQYNYNISGFSNFVAGPNNITYNTYDTGAGINYTNNTNIFVYSGINITDFRSNDGTAVWEAFTWLASNATHSNTSSSRVGTYIPSNILPTGTTNMTLVNNTSYTIPAFVFNLNRTPYFVERNGTASPYGNIIVISFASCDGTSWSAFDWSAINTSGNTGEGNANVGAKIPVSQIPIGNVLFSIRNDTNYFNSTFNLTVGQLTSNSTTPSLADRRFVMNITQTLDEIALTPIIFRTTVSNSTHTFIENYSSNFSGYRNSTFPYGAVSILIENSTNYVSRTYYTTVSTCSYYNEYAYLLPNTGGVYHYVRFHTLSNIGTSLTDVTVVAQKQIGGIWTTVETAVSDGTGTATMWLDGDTTYYMTASKTGYTSSSITQRPSGNDYNTMLGGGGSTSTVSWTNVWNNVNYYFLPSHNTLNGMNYTPTQPYGNGNVTTNYTVSYFVYSSDNTFTSYGLDIIWNHTILWSGSNTTSGGGVINAVFNVSGNQSVEGCNYITALGYFNKAGYNTTYVTRNYILTNYNYGNYTLFGILQRMDIDPNALAFIIIVASIAIGIFASYMTISWYIGGFISLIFMSGLGTMITYSSPVDGSLHSVIPMIIIISLWIIFGGVFMYKGVQ